MEGNRSNIWKRNLLLIRVRNRKQKLEKKNQETLIEVTFTYVKQESFGGEYNKVWHAEHKTEIEGTRKRQRRQGKENGKTRVIRPIQVIRASCMCVGGLHTSVAVGAQSSGGNLRRKMRRFGALWYTVSTHFFFIGLLDIVGAKPHRRNIVHPTHPCFLGINCRSLLCLNIWESQIIMYSSSSFLQLHLDFFLFRNWVRSFL